MVIDCAHSPLKRVKVGRSAMCDGSWLHDCDLRGGRMRLVVIHSGLNLTKAKGV